MTLLNSLFSWIIKKRIHQIELFTKHPLEVQGEVFMNLIDRGKETFWGKKYGYHDIKDFKTYCDRVPLSSYEDLKRYIERQKKGEKNILWPGEVKWFAKSSGTTSDKSKYIPVSKESLEDCHYKAGKDMLALYYHNKPHTEIFDGKSLVVGGSTQINHFSSDSYYGDLSAIIIKNLPFWVEYRRTPNISVALLSEWEEKIEKMAKITADEDVTNISGVPSWTLVLLKRILEIKNASNILDVWPNLELYMHGGVSFTPYKDSFQKIIGKNNHIDFLETYNASEGFFGIQYKPDSSEMLLMLDYGIFYEFVPQSEWNKEHPQTILLDEVQVGEVYELIISTNGGLWRYRLGDTITFTSTAPFLIKVAGRTKHFINAFGEELMIHNVDKALAIASHKTEALIADYTAAPKFGDKTGEGCHEWIIEFEKEPTNIDEFKKIFDKELKQQNSDYEAKRHKNMVLKEPKFHVVPPKTFYNWMKSRGKLGGQNKVPRLSNDRKFVDAILQFINSEPVL